MSSRTQRLTPILLVWAVTRALVFLSVLITAERLGAGDLGRYASVGDALTAGRHVEVWEYPIGSLAVTLPPVLLGVETYVEYLVVFMALAVGLDFATLAAVLVATPDRGSWNTRGAWIWVLGPALLGFITITRLDVAACCAAAAGMAIAVRRGDGRASGALLALGASIKVWPGLFILPFLIDRTRRRDAIVGAAAATAAFALIGVAFGLRGLLLDFVRYQTERGLQIESLAALPLLWADQLGVADYRPEFRFGSQQLLGPGVEIAATSTSLMTSAALALLLVYCFRRREQIGERPELGLFAGFVGLLILVLTNKVFSPQYMLWLITPLAALGACRGLVTNRLVGTLLAAVATTHLLFPYQYADLVDGELFPLIILSVRDAILVVLLVLSLRGFRAHLRVDTPRHPDDFNGQVHV